MVTAHRLGAWFLKVGWFEREHSTKWRKRQDSNLRRCDPGLRLASGHNTVLSLFRSWLARQVSNLQPPGPKPGALPIALRANSWSGQGDSNPQGLFKKPYAFLRRVCTPMPPCPGGGSEWNRTTWAETTGLQPAHAPYVTTLPVVFNTAQRIGPSALYSRVLMLESNHDEERLARVDFIIENWCRRWESNPQKHSALDAAAMPDSVRLQAGPADGGCNRTCEGLKSSASTLGLQPV